MADYYTIKCIFRSGKKEFFETLKTEQKLIGNDLYKYLYENSRELFDEYEVKQSSYDFDSESELIIKEEKNESEICFTYINEPSPNAAYCLAETIARKAGLHYNDVQIITYYWPSGQFLVTNDPLLRDKVLITNFDGCADTDFWHELNSNLENCPFIIVDEQFNYKFYEPSEFLDKIKQTIKNENLKGYENLGEDYEFNNDYSSNKIDDWFDFNDKAPSDDILAILDFADRYENQNGESSINPYFLIYLNQFSTQQFNDDAANDLYYTAEELFNSYANNNSNEDLEKALYYYEQFFEEADEYFGKEEIVTAAYILGSYYFEGQGCKQDKKKAFYYSKFVEENYTDKEDFARVSYILGQLYYQGEVCEQNKEKSEEYFNNDADIYYELYESDDMYYEELMDIGDFYSDAGDYEKAIKWYTRALDEGSEEAKEKLEEVKKKIK